MQTRRLIRLDAWLGVPLCALIDLARAPIGWLRPWRADPRPPEHILVTKFLGLGSILLATPLLRRLRATYPTARITFLTFGANAELVRRLPEVDRVEVVRPGAGVLGLLASVPGLLWRLRRQRFDLAIDLEFYSRLSNLVNWGSGARRRVGFFVRDRFRGALLTDPVYFNPTLPYGDAVQALLRPLGLEPGQGEPLVAPVVARAEAFAAQRRLLTLGVPTEGTVVVLNVNASDLCYERRWPGERYARLVERFGDEIAHADRFVFIGTAGESGTVREVLTGIRADLQSRCLDLSGRTSLVELTCLLQRAALLITNDSGPLHLAAALDVPTVSLFGPETPALYGPVGSRHLVLYAGHWCSPCLSVYNAKIAMCHGENECMRRIGLDQVVQATARFCREEVGLAPPLPEGRRSREPRS